MNPNALQPLLDALQQQAGAQTVLLLERSGQRLGASGDVLRMDLTTVGAAATGIRAGAAALARCFGQQGTQELSGQCGDQSFFLMEVDANALLLVVFDHRSNLGLVGHKARRIAPDLAQYLSPSAGGAAALSPDDYENLWG
ncbi:MAG: roadblock/LC7 domain-containing protein [Myxococcota bacterium]|nr:hypothetical protein [Myxococcales bacterium]MEC7751151.1 roadblock/LC7 domain-containing protein [Myxococcota bacterium]HBU47661.1 hypothetical protein [Myxococcales bacterium]